MASKSQKDNFSLGDAIKCIKKDVLILIQKGISRRKIVQYLRDYTRYIDNQDHYFLNFDEAVEMDQKKIALLSSISNQLEKLVEPTRLQDVRTLPLLWPMQGFTRFGIGEYLKSTENTSRIE